MRGFDPAFMNELKAKNNLIDVIGSYVSLDKKGNNYWACCPFHHEKTPSFSVNASDQFYHCFGCGVSGDVIKFVQEIESVDFPDAVKILADRAKIPVPDSSFDTEELVRKKKQKETMLKIMLATAKFYRNNLYGGRADKHVDYLTRRKILPSTIKKFGFGASLDFRSLPEFLLDSGFKREDILAAGVCAEGKNRSLYDFQAERLIIPIINQFDEVVAFGGRLLENKDFAKYKNTQETVLFNKRKVLYNVNLLKKLKKEQAIHNVIVVEGYMDAITVYQAGFRNVVACMGTSLTPDQARLIKRYTDNILISFDGDSAGQAADMRGIDIFRQENLNVKVVPIDGGKDPDEVIKNYGSERYKECLDKAMPIVDYRLYALEKKFDLNKTEEKRNYVSESLKIIQGEREATVREELVRNLSKKTGFSVTALTTDLNNTPKGSVEIEEKEEIEREDPEWTKGIPNKVAAASRFILAAKLFQMDYAKSYAMRSELFLCEEHTRIAEYVAEATGSGEKIVPSYIFEIVDPENEEIGQILALHTDDKLFGADAEAYFEDCVKTFESYTVKKRLLELSERLKVCTDEEERKYLLQKMTELTSSLKRN